MAEETTEKPHQATVQFRDGSIYKIVTGDIVEETEDHITIECEHAKYRLNKSSVDWIKYNLKK